MGRRAWVSWTWLGLSLIAARGGFAVDAPSALAKAEDALTQSHPDQAVAWIDKALERDPRSLAAWDLRARWAEAGSNRDELALSLYRGVRLAIAQGAAKKDVAARRAKLESVDPESKELLDFTSKFIARLVPIAEGFEKAQRRHAAIRLHTQILALDPERTQSIEAIDRISCAPDPSLAESAKPKDLLADVSSQWIADHDAKHNTWDTASKLERANYITTTDCGYEVMVRAAEAMEHMNAFYRRFFHYGDDGKKTVPRIALRIFKGHDEYLKLGQHPAEWSGGQFTGGAVETYVGDGGFAETTTTLFHEASHQFVGLATTAVGWLNEGLASFMEGSRMLSNGTVKTNMPANHRLFPLASRMEKGWMSGPDDGIAPAGTKGPDPEKAPTFRIVIEDKYTWGPPWYAPTWGVVYFLYDFQDPNDGRFVYRDAFHEFINASGARSGKGAVENFEKVVLAHPEKTTPGFKLPDGATPVALPKSIDDIDLVWKDWILALRDEQSGKVAAVRPFLKWARCAIERKDFDDATEHFENGIEATPNDYDLCMEFAEHLATRSKNPDRAVKLVLHAQRVAQSAAKPDAARIDRAEKLLAKIDPSLHEIEKIQTEMAVQATSIADAYASAGLPLMTMDTTRRFGADLGIDGMFPRYEAAARKAARSLAIWENAYDEKGLRGWTGGDASAFKAAGEQIDASLGKYVPDSPLQYQPLTLERTTSGDFSIETEVNVESGKGAFAGLVFGMKGGSAFHALLFSPSTPASKSKDGQPISAYVDLSSFYGGGNPQIWRHNPVGLDVSGWHTLRADIAGATVDVWFDGDLVVTQVFSSADVLRGGFGLFTGPGEAHFRNIRFLARDKGDPAGQIERKIRMEKIRAAGGAIGGSWLGAIPPFPEHVDWVKNPRKSWSDKGQVPTLLVFWSINQDKLVPIRAWLQDLVTKHADVGLEVVAICGPTDVAKVTDYLRYEPFPGAIGVDHEPTATEGRKHFGATFDAYSIGSRFNLPRLVLLDIDGTVVWEGGPGFKPNVPWQAGFPTYLDTPLRSLLSRRKLTDIAAWRKAWIPRGARAADEGDFETAWPLLQQAAALPADGPADVVRVGDGARKLQAALAAPDAFAEFAAPIAQAGREPAIVALLDFAKAAKIAIKPLQKTMALVHDDTASAWNTAWHKAAAAAKSLPAGNEADTLRALATEFAALPGAFPKALAADLGAALEKNDLDAAKRLCAEAERRPVIWLLGEGLGLAGR